MDGLSVAQQVTASDSRLFMERAGKFIDLVIKKLPKEQSEALAAKVAKVRARNEDATFVNAGTDELLKAGQTEDQVKTMIILIFS